MGVAERKYREFIRRENDILAAAIDLFKTDRWHSVTVEEIAERAEIGKGTVYKHFASKDEIYARLVLDHQAVWIERLQQLDRSQDVIRRLRAIIAVTFEMSLVGEEHRRLVQHASRDEFRDGLSAEAKAAFARQDDAYFDVVRAVLEEGVRVGILPRKPTQDLMFGPLASFLGARMLMWNRCMLPGPPPGADAVDELTRFVLAGMLYQESLVDDGLFDDDV